MTERAERCETCRFWNVSDPIKVEGRELCQCRCMSPRAEFGAWWPLTALTDWCGNWEGVKPQGRGLPEAVLVDGVRYVPESVLPPTA